MMSSRSSPVNAMPLRQLDVNDEQLSTLLNYVLQLTKILLVASPEAALDAIDEQVVELLATKLAELTPVASSFADSLILILAKKFPSMDLSADSPLRSQLSRILTHLLNYLKVPEVVLSIGGDDRLTISPKTGQNKYYASTFARSALIRRGSCTCSTLTTEGYDLAWKLHLEFLHGAIKVLLDSHDYDSDQSRLSVFYQTWNQQIINRLLSVFGLTNDLALQVPTNQWVQSPQLVLFPSGSDAEFLPLVIALIRSYRLNENQRKLNGNPHNQQELWRGIQVTNYVIAAGEVGSGTPQAAIGQHFSPLSPRGTSQTAGRPLVGIHSEMIDMIPYKPRDASGQVAFQEEQLLQDIMAKLRASTTAVILLHLVCGSKTGLIYPSQDFLQRLQSYNTEVDISHRVIVVVDACQLRNRLSSIASYLQQNYLLLVTGSKFYTGPPFCAAVLLPASIANEIESYVHDCQRLGEASLIPVGLEDYITSYEMSHEMKGLREYFTQNSTTHWFNYGLSLRWAMSLDLMERYHRLPVALIQTATALWVTSIKELIGRHSPFIQLLVDTTTGIVDQTIVQSLNTILSIRLFVTETTSPADSSSSTTTTASSNVLLRELSFDEYKQFHALLTTLSPVIMLGQPVKLSENTSSGGTVLRIALGADMIISLLEPAITETGVAVEAGSGLEKFLVHQLTEAFQKVTSYYHSHPLACFEEYSKPEDLAYLGGVFSAHQTDNPFLPTVQKLVKDDFIMIDQIFQQLLSWKQPPVKSSSPPEKKRFLTENKYLLEKQVKGLLLDKYFYHDTIPYNTKEEEEMSYQMKVLPQVIQTITTRLSEDPVATNAMIIYDLDYLMYTIQLLQSSFASPSPSPSTAGAASYLHCFAIKSCPLTYLLQVMASSGLGFECASINEVKQALAIHTPPDRIVYDSPCKTLTEISFALEVGVRINANSLVDLEKLSQVMAERQAMGLPQSTSQIGIRVNPLIGTGKIVALSTANQTSKFGIPLFDSSNSNSNSHHNNPFLAVAEESIPITTDYLTTTASDEIFRQIDQELYRKDPSFTRLVDRCVSASKWLTGVMCHVGSQGMSLSLMIQGVERIFVFMKYLEWKSQQRSQQTSLGFTWIDIGGGLSCNYHSNTMSPSFQDYYQGLVQRLPALFASPLLILTEFGKSIIAKSAVMVSRIEDIIECPTTTSTSITTTEKKQTLLLNCILHLGADLMVRTAYCPEQFSHHRFQLIDGSTNQYIFPTTTTTETSDRTGYDPIITEEAIEPSEVIRRRPLCVQQISLVGPLCFSGDIIAKQITFPRPQRGDRVIIADVGANTLSMVSRHCSRQLPTVVAFRRISYSHESAIVVQVIKAAESSEEVIQFWD